MHSRTTCIFHGEGKILSLAVNEAPAISLYIISTNVELF
jgi:hypothetical protein